MQSTWPSQSKHKIEKKYKSMNTLQRITQVPVNKIYKNHANALIEFHNSNFTIKPKSYFHLILFMLLVFYFIVFFKYKKTHLTNKKMIQCELFNLY